MKKRWTFAPVLLVAGFAMLAAGAATLPLSEEPKPTKSSTPYHICPLYEYANHGTYSSYYAVMCPGGVPVMLEAEPGLFSFGCDGPFEDCILIITSEKASKDKDAKKKSPPGVHLGHKFFVQHKKHDSTNGISKGYPGTKRTKAYPFKEKLKLHAKLFGGKKNVKVQVADGDSFFATLVVVSVTLPGQDTLFARVGYEIEDPGGNPKPVLPDDVESIADTKCYVVKHGNIRYRVIKMK